MGSLTSWGTLRMYHNEEHHPLVALVVCLPLQIRLTMNSTLVQGSDTIEN